MFEPDPLRTSENKAGQLNLSLEPQRRVFRVSELNAALQRVLESDFQGIWVSGEISGCRVAPSGHHYFALKDRENQVKAVLFKSTARYLRCKPQDGLAVIARGNLEIYSARGEYQLIVDSLEPQGAGALQLAFEELKRRLAAEGLFDQGRKRPLPRFPRRIAIITSSAGAVIQDFLNVLHRRFPGLHVRLYPTLVQGEFAAEQISEALAWFGAHRWPDVLVVARGGGSLQDLWAFNEERVARAIASCPIPVISAIGHETDFTIADFVADLRAPTPSAAAELLICTRESLLEQFATLEKRTLQSLRYRLLRATRDLHQKGGDRAAALIDRSIHRYAQRCDDAEAAATRATRRRIQVLEQRRSSLSQRLSRCDVRLSLARSGARLGSLGERLSRALQTRINTDSHRQQSLLLHLKQLSPLTVLSRGYAIVQDESGHALRSADETSIGAALSIRLHSGAIAARVTETKQAPGDETSG